MGIHAVVTMAMTQPGLLFERCVWIWEGRIREASVNYSSFFPNDNVILAIEVCVCVCFF